MNFLLYNNKILINMIDIIKLPVEIYKIINTYTNINKLLLSCKKLQDIKKRIILFEIKMSIFI